MADETSTTPPQGARGGGNREPGGFRIRLSDNEMRSARALQEAFRLRSTVAVLGFALRTLGQMLEEGKLDDLVAEQRSQPGNRDDARPRRGAGERPSRGPAERAPRVDPFARPSRPAAAAAADPEPIEPSPAAEALEEEASEEDALNPEAPLESSDAPAADGTAETQAEADTTPAES
jgi:hypothetical protein